jgi:acyl carrier protein
MRENEILDLILETARDYIQSMGGEAAGLDAESRLFGPSGVVDSLGLVAILVELEQKLNERSGQPLALMDERAMSQACSSFRTPRSLAEYAVTLLTPGGEAARGA